MSRKMNRITFYLELSSNAWSKIISFVFDAYLHSLVREHITKHLEKNAELDLYWMRVQSAA